MKFNPEKMQQMPDSQDDIVDFLEKGMKAQQLLDEAFIKARNRKANPDLIKREEVEKAKSKYDDAAREFGQARSKLPLDVQEKFSKLDTLKKFQDKYNEEMSKTRDFKAMPELREKKVETQTDRDFFNPEEGMTEPDKDFFVPEEGEEKVK